MNWFYSENSQTQRGPVDQAEFDRLVQSGDIRRSTLVWRDGMAGWRAFGELNLSQHETAAAGSSRCVECGRFFVLDDLIKLPPGLVCSGCKPLVLQKIGEGIFHSRVEQTRLTYLQHEASVKSIGTLYFVCAAGFLLFALVSVFAPISRMLLLGILALGFAVLQAVTALGIRKLNPKARIPTAVISGLGLLAFPFGTIVNGYILYRVFSRKGAMVFSEEYKQVIAGTPHIKYRSSFVVRVLLGVVLAILALVIFGAIIAPMF